MYCLFLGTRRWRLAGGERGSRLSQVELYNPCERVRATEEAPCDRFYLLEHRHGLAEHRENGGSSDLRIRMCCIVNRR